LQPSLLDQKMEAKEDVC